MGFNRDDWDDKSIDLGALREDSRRFYAVIGEMTGHGGDVRSTITQGAFEFSDMIQESIKSQGSYDESLWTDASMYCVVGAGCTDTYISNVEDFRKKLDELQEEWDNYPDPPKRIYESADNGNGATVNTGKLSPEMQAYLDNKAEKLKELEKKAEEALEKLEEQTSEVNSDIESGPSDVVVKKLVEGGFIGWSAYNILGAGQPVPIAFDGSLGEQDAEKVAQAIENGEDIPPEILAGITYLNNAAIKKRERGEELTESEITYLRNFYATLDEEIDGGVLALPELIMQGKEKTNEELKNTSSVIANGLLTLSHEESGGGLQMLPESIQSIVAGPSSYNTSDGKQVSEWSSDVWKISSLLAYSDEEVEGGLEFSAGLTTAIAAELATKDGEPGLWSTLDEKVVGRYGLDAPESTRGEILENILKVSLRNPDANHAFLTGEYEHEKYKKKEISDLIANLFKPQWPDGGKAVSGLIDWIPDYKNSEDPEKVDNAGEAVSKFIEAVTLSPGIYDELTDTKVKFGNDSNASFTSYNPAIASSLLDIYGSYITDFSMPPEGDTSIGYFPDLKHLALPPESRLIFLEYIAADENAAQSMVAVTESAKILNMDYSNDQTGTHGISAGRANGTLDKMLQASLTNEAYDRTGDADAVEKSIAETKKKGVEIALNAAFSAIPLSDPLSKGASAFMDSSLSATQDGISFTLTKDIKENLDNYKGSHGKIGEGISPAAAERQAKLTLTGAMVRNGDLDVNDVEKLTIIENTNGEKQVATGEEQIYHTAEKEAFEQYQEGGALRPSPGETIDKSLDSTLAEKSITLGDGEEVSVESYLSNYKESYNDQDEVWRPHIASSAADRDDISRRWGVKQ